MKTIGNLQSHIMRRVYYAFGLRLAAHPVTLHLAVLLGAAYALKELVYVKMVWQNIAATPVGELGSKLISILFQADTLSLLVLGVAVMTALSLRWQLSAPRPLPPFEPAA